VLYYYVCNITIISIREKPLVSQQTFGLAEQSLAGQQCFALRDQAKLAQFPSGERDQLASPTAQSDFV
jgi:hypothetical protein